MVGNLLLRGMLAGMLAGLLAFGCAKVLGEPLVDRAIAFEDQMNQDKGEAAEPELVSREIQSTVGLLVGVVVYGTGMGGLFALVFAFAQGRTGAVSGRALAALLAAAAFVAIYLVPDLKYPANPPSVGIPETIGYRTGLYFFMVAFSVVALAFAVIFGRRLARRLGNWNAVLAGGAIYILLILGVQTFLPDINEVPQEFPAVMLWQFRIASLGIQAVMWAAVGLLFGAFMERSRQRSRAGLTQPSHG